MRLFVDGKWTGKEDRSITVKEGDEIVTYNLDEYAKEHGIELPDSKKHKPKDIKKEVNSNADMGQQDDSGDHKVDGNGDSESSE
tara:strand:+ start:323 stop:574 length:252 start_codon:yes stop_codon:yes gene_type:complete